MFGRPAAATLATIVVTSVAIISSQTSLATPATERRAADFLERLQQAVDSADRRAVSAMVAYPLTVLASGFNIPVKDSAAFIRMYDSFSDPGAALRGGQLRDTSTGRTAARRAALITPDGLSLVDGAIWAPFKEGRYRIARIRVLPPAPSVEGRKTIEHVTFAEPKGERSASFAGWLVRQNVDGYVVVVRRSETLQVRIDGFRGHDATLRVSPQITGAARPTMPLRYIGRTISTTAAADGEYRIEVGHLGRYCDPPQRYKLTVVVR